MPFGYAGRILHVDLTAQKTWVESPPESFYRTYFGGSALAMHYLLKEMKPGVDALSPDNILALTIGVPTGAPFSGQSRLAANAKSPLTGTIGDAQAGGFFPAEMKFAGFDAVIVRGRASRPVYLWLHDGDVEIRDAAHLTGKTTSEADDLIRDELADPKIEIAQCGPAGEKMVRTACIINMANRANGRTGMGAVMGSKNLRAVAVRGKNKRLPLFDPKRVNELAKWGAAQVMANPDMKGLREDGTAGVASTQQVNGTLPTRNYNEGQFEHFADIMGETMTETILKERDTCYGCATHCKRVVETEWQGRPVEPRHGGPEYETVATFGSYLGVKSLPAIAMANKICNEYGLDTIGAGATIAWAMECFEKGVLSEAEIGFPLRFGDDVAAIRALEMLANREGFGDVLAEGSAGAAAKLGKGAEFLITTKGNEAPAHMPQSKRSLAIIYAVNPFGADHQSSEHDPNSEEGAADRILDRLKMVGVAGPLPKYSLDADKAHMTLQTQKFYSFLDSACLCQFDFGPAWTMYGPAETVELMKAVSGWQDFTLEELLEIGERRINMMRVFNAREGFDRKDDILPPKFFQPLAGTGPTAGMAIDRAEWQAAVNAYYQLAGWDQERGLPTREKLTSLGLDWLVQ
ncbi:MAG: aldehyde ferredoxin oxidoreductase family protein [Chloroflexota bacterium]